MLNELPLLNDVMECSCDKCVGACRKKPGWFVPEEIKPAADFLGLTEKEFFDKYLSVDYFTDPDGFLYVLSPATDKSEPGKEFPLEPSGRCIFLTDDEKCSIHSVKPFECKYFDHRKLDAPPDVNEHRAVAEAWTAHKDKIAELLGREPNAETNPFEMLEFLMNMIERVTKNAE